ncbi:MAG: T9SS type A sorting domain-containing protein [Bacteroidetes bacterium]|nr:T9SS type A sorting domain-containing protein [Bacteroidota bacterium]
MNSNTSNRLFFTRVRRGVAAPAKVMRAGLSAILCLFFAVGIYAQTGPAGVSSGLILWLDASDLNANGSNPADGSAFTTWKDRSGLGHDASSFGSLSPKYYTNRINGNPTVTFTRSSNAIGTGFQVPAVDIRGGTHPQVTIFTVYRQGTSFPSQQQAVWGDDNGDWDRFFFTKFVYTGAGPDDGGVSFGMGGTQTVQLVRNSGAAGLVQLLTATYNGSGTTAAGANNGSSIYFNGQLVTNFTDRTDPTNAQTAMRIGLDGDDNYFDGEIAEVLVYSRLLSQCDVEAVNHYLSAKYGTGYDVAVNYSNLSPLIDIKGVGNFSTSCITNVINSATSSIVTIANPEVSTSGNNLTFANDAGGFGVSTDVPSGYKTRLKQLWRTDEKGSVGKVDVTFDLTGLGVNMVNAANFDLLVSPSAGFSGGAALTPASRTISGSTVTFTGVTLPKGYYFTISLAQVPTAAIQSIADDTGPSSTDFVTNDASLTISGTATPGASVTLRSGSSVLGTTAANASGDWAISKVLSDGTYNLSTDVSLNGASVAGTSSKTLVVDLTKPAKPDAPGIPGLIDGTVANTGALTATGTTEAGATVFVYDNGVLLGTATNNSGNYSYTFNPVLSEGSHSIDVVVTDLAGNVSDAGTAKDLVVDLTPPAKPGAPMVTGSVDGIVSTGAVVVTGTAEPGSTVDVYSGGVKVGTVTADATTGAWSYTASPSLADGAYSLTVKATDKAGNSSVESDATSVIVDTTPPAKPGSPVVTGAVDGLVSTGAVVVTGTAEAGSIVDVYSDGVKVGTVTADATTGEWSLTFAPALSDGNHALTVKASDKAGNVSVASDVTSVTVDTTPPQAPGAPVADGLHNGYETTGAFTVTGVAEPGAAVDVASDGVKVGTVVADPTTGAYSYTFAPALADGNHSVTVTATDKAGNVSVASDATSVDVDSTPPGTPMAPAIPGENDGYVNTGIFTLTGKTEPNATVVIYDKGVQTGMATADANGDWSYPVTPAFKEGDHVLSITATDVAGNTSNASQGSEFTVDTEAPQAPVGPAYTGGNDGVINTNDPAVTGKAEPGSTVTVYDNGVAVGTTMADGDGNWSFSFSPALADGGHSLTAVATDKAGNESPAGPALMLTVDTKAPSVQIGVPGQSVNASFTATITFSEKVDGLDIFSINAVNATLSDLTKVNDSVYTVLVTPVSESAVSLSIGAGVTNDRAGNGNTASNSPSLEADFAAVVDQVYPVPARSDLHIRFAGIAPEKGRVVLIDMAGHYVYDREVQLRGQVLTINVSAFSAGTYILRVQAKNYTYRTKVIIAH